MKISQLLSQREGLLKQARLANLAYAYAKLEDFAQRIARARLTGEVNLLQADPKAGGFWPMLTAREGSQSVIEEHFTEEDVTELADIIAFFTGATELDLTFRIEELAERFAVPLRRELERAGVAVSALPSAAESPDGPGAHGCSQRGEGI
jgi:hypothetical protein